ncbi:hypothetical protein Tco_0361156 [Tanacetum coccineum]
MHLLSLSKNVRFFDHVLSHIALPTVPIVQVALASVDATNEFMDSGFHRAGASTIWTAPTIVVLQGGITFVVVQKLQKGLIVSEAINSSRARVRINWDFAFEKEAKEKFQQLLQRTYGKIVQAWIHEHFKRIKVFYF